MSVNGKRIVVTGAGRGIGAGLAAFLRSRGAQVFTCDVSPGGVDVVCDVSNPEQVDSMFRAAGRVDGLVNNAALLVGRRDYDEIDLDDWDRMMAVNVRGTFLCARAAAATMRAGGHGGSIVNIASETAFTGSHGFAHYVASKGAVVSLTRALANEMGKHGIRVNCVAPGFTVTPGSDALGGYDTSKTPLGRVTLPEDHFGTIAHFLSDDSAFVTGQALLVNGGKIPH